MIAFIYDTETTGLISNSLIPMADQPRIIEFFGHLIDTATGKAVDELEFFANPGAPLEPIITKITGITDADLCNEKPFSANTHRLKQMLIRAEGIVAHNLSFDLAMLANEFARLGEAFSPPRRKICTVEQSEWYCGHRLSLTALHEHLFGEPFAGAHRARHDVEALTRCFLEMWKRGDV